MVGVPYVSPRAEGVNTGSEQDGEAAKFARGRPPYARFSLRSKNTQRPGPAHAVAPHYQEADPAEEWHHIEEAARARGVPPLCYVRD